MVFSSMFFLCIFLPIVLLLYFIVPKKAKNYLLLIVSLIFYAWGEPTYILLLLVSIMLNYLFGLGVSEKNKLYVRKVILIIAVVVNLGLLVFFKYVPLIVTGINGLSLIFNFTPIEGIASIVLPLGISFYTFQALSYVIDVYRKTTKVQKNPFYVGLYISLFPQLIAGPIVRYVDIEKEIIDRRVTLDGFYSGTKRFIIGLAKKVLIANNAAIIADMVFGQPANLLTAGSAWVGAVAYTIQIFFDFSGYSDMAIGMGRMFGFHFLENFNYPYIARSIQDFWRRWHISLSTWFRDYLYIPLGGNRKGAARTYLNLAIVFLLCGLWHGAAITFIIWGAYYGVFLIIERLGFNKVLQVIPKWTRHLYALLVIIIGWVIFRSESPGYVLQYISAMFGGTAGGYDVFSYLSIRKTIIVIAAGVFFSIPILRWIKEKRQCNKAQAGRTKKVMQIVGCIGIIGILMVSMIYLANDSYNPFIYFRF